MIELKRNKETGIVETWKDGKKIGEVITMGDMINGGNESQRQHTTGDKRNN